MLGMLRREITLDYLSGPSMQSQCLYERQVEGDSAHTEGKLCDDGAESTHMQILLFPDL